MAREEALTDRHGAQGDIRPRLLNRRQAAAYLGVSIATLDSWRAMGLFKAVPLPAVRARDNGRSQPVDARSGRMRVPLFDVSDLDSFIDKLKENHDA